MMSKTIDERIKDHEKAHRDLTDKKDALEYELNIIDEELIFHWITIQNLARMKITPKND